MPSRYKSILRRNKSILKYSGFKEFKPLKTVIKHCFYTNDIHKRGNDNGKILSKQLEHCFICIPKGECRCSIDKFEPSQLTVQTIRYLLERNIILDKTDVPIYHSRFGIISHINVAHYKNQPDTLVKLCLKSGNAEQSRLDSDSTILQRIGLGNHNVHSLKSTCEDTMMLETYGFKPDSSFILYIRDRDSNENLDIRLHSINEETWSKNSKTKRTIFSAIKSKCKTC